MHAPDATNRCEICGQPTDLAVTEIVAPRGAVVTRHYCQTHWPHDDDVFFKKELDTAIDETLTACVLRDAGYHALTREMAELRMRPTFDRAAELLGEGFDCRARSLVHLSLQFATWQALRQSHDPASAAALMADAVHGVPRAKQ